MTYESSVIVIHEKTTDSLVLTERTTHLRDHPGEICFPGGRWEPGDYDLWATALRELEEELGVEKTRITLLKKMRSERTRKGVIIQPWYASLETLEPYAPNTDEVAQVLLLPMQQVSNVNNYKEMVIMRRSQRVTTYQFTASRHFVWGATACIMRQLCTT